MTMEKLNSNIEISSSNEIAIIVEELLDKEEFVCTFDACGAHACGVYSV